MPRKPRDIESYDHSDKERANNPPVGLVTPATDPDETATAYAHDPHIDPELSWAGKTEHTSFEVPTVSLHVHERIDPRTIIEAVRKPDKDARQPSFFDFVGEQLPFRQAIEFYKHRHGWSNRLIAGDSLLVMNSLLEKEGLGGKVQTIYMDPPYGIRYGSNFQPFVSQVGANKDRDRDLTGEPEQIRAFRDTWELGIHSYLTYMRDRLLLSHELLTPSGSCFVQIGKENIHRVAMLMDEIFGTDNRIATICYTTTGGSAASTLPEVANYLLWYAKDRDHVKYRQLYEPLSRREIIEHFNWHAMVQQRDGTLRKPTKEERFDPDQNLPKDARIYRRMPLDSQGTSSPKRLAPFHYMGRAFRPAKGNQWRVSKGGLDRLAELGRLESLEGQSTLGLKKFEDEVPGRPITNVWSSKLVAQGKVYVVQTSTKVAERAILMTSDPGDLVFDPTAGSGTTAFAAELWGRRWITCDTSRVAIAIARQRLATASYKFYLLERPEEGVASGFSYKSVPKVSAAILAYDQPAQETVLYDQPIIDTKKARVTGPFTVEAVPAPTVRPIDNPSVEPISGAADTSVARSGKTQRHVEWRDELLKSGIRGKGGQKLNFARLETLPGTRWLHADGDLHPPPHSKFTY